MGVYIENERDKELFPGYKEVIIKVVKEALRYEKCPYEAEVNVIITGNEDIREINRENRGIDRATDVLSFPMNEFKSPGDFGMSGYEFNPENGELLLGDIVISGEKAMEQADEYGHSIERETAFLTAHSMLHLMGYDHEKEEDRLIMEKKQRDILEGLGILR